VTVLEVLQSTTAYFQKRAIESPRLNAEHLLAHSLGKKRIELYLEFERALSETELAPLRELVRRRAQREPLQHLLGTVEFCGQTFVSDKRALIPRPETEELVELVIAETGERKPERILDLGTGSGVIALSLAMAFSSALIYASDISEDALALARENAQRLGLAERVRFEKRDLLSEMSERFDLIVANLPYVPTTDRDSLSPEVNRDPELAVFGGERGDEIVRRLIQAAPPHLASGGLLALEIGIDQAEGLVAFLREQNYHDISARQDYAGVTRFLLARYG
jgi:release factor glutamine methyltransferase